MTVLHKTYGLVIVILLITGCIEPFTPEIDTFEDLLVVEALISEEESSHYIKLSRSGGLDSEGYPPENGAVVTLTDGNGQATRFFESNSAGSYSPPPGRFNPMPGDTYILTILTQDGAEYRSDPVIMVETNPIDSVYFERVQLPFDETESLEDGFRILLNTGEGTASDSYYKFEWEETWEIATPYQSFLVFDNGYPEVRDDNISICWNSERSTNLNIASTENFSTNLLTGHPVRFIPFYDPKLNIKYSILVKQYRLNESSYNFWQNLKDSNESTGSLYDKQPFRVLGNIRNINNQSEPVLGHFDMATSSSERIFIDNIMDVPEDVSVPSLFLDCRVDADTTISYSQIPLFINRGYLISYYNFGVGYVMAKKSCIDCRSKGENVKPEFWE